MAKKQFPLGVVLAITTGRLLCDMGGIYEILNHMTKDDLFTHQLPGASKQCKPVLLAQFPELAVAEGELPKLDDALGKVRSESETAINNTRNLQNKIFLQDREKALVQEALTQWLSELNLPETFDVEQLENPVHKDPIEELIEMREGK